MKVIAPAVRAPRNSSVMEALRHARGGDVANATRLFEGVVAEQPSHSGFRLAFVVLAGLAVAAGDDGEDDAARAVRRGAGVDDLLDAHVASLCDAAAD